jgi:hypothetical protein
MGFFMLASNAKAVGLSCHQVLMTTESLSAQLEQALDALAKLKMAVDSTRARGAMNSIEANMGATYNKKFKEMLGSLQGRMNEQQLREQLIQRIRKIQGVVLEVQKQEQKRRGDFDELAARGLPFFQAEKYLVDNREFADFQFVSKEKKALYFVETQTHRYGFYIFDLETRQLKHVQAVSPILLNDGQVLFFDSKKVARIYDVATGVQKPYLIPNIKYDITPPQTQTKLSISKSKKWAAIFDLNYLDIFDPLTGESTPAKFVLPKRNILGWLANKTPPCVRMAEFLNDSEILLLVGEDWYKFNFKTNKFTQLKLKKLSSHWIADIKVSPDQKSALISDTNKNIFYVEISDLENFTNARNLNQLLRDSRSYNGDKIFHGNLESFDFIDDGQGISISTGRGSLYVDAKTLEPLVDFSTVALEASPNTTPLISADKREVYFVQTYDATDSRGFNFERFIEVWSKDMRVQE